jgi:multiple sugar transport system substrate-binding protein
MMPLWMPTHTKQAVAQSRRMMARLRSRFAIIGLFSLIALLVACQSPTLPTWLGGTQQAATPTAIPIQTALTMWAWPASSAEDAHLQALLDAYQAQHPGLAINLTFTADYGARLRTALGSDNPPDLLYLNSFYLPDLVANGALAALPAALLADPDLDPHLRAAMQVAGTPYCLPKVVDTLALLYNRTLFAAAGVPTPDENWNWETLRSSAEALTDLDAGRYGLVLPPDFSRWLPFLYQAGGAITNPEGTAMAINSPEAQAALNFYVDLVLDGFAAPPTMLDSRWPGEAFATGRAAMTIEGNWIIPYLATQAPDMDYGVALLPSGPAGRATLSFTTCYALTAASAEQAAAQQVIVYLAAAQQLASGLALNSAIPARLTVQARWLEEYPALAPFVLGLDHAHEWQLPAKLQPLLTTINEDLRRTFGGFILAESVLPAAEAAGNEALAPE